MFASARRCWGWAFGWKGSGAKEFYFCNDKVKILPIDNIWKFATFNLYTTPAKILYLQRYSTDFRNLCLSSKILRVGIWVESLRCACILLLQWQDENFEYRQNLKVCHFKPVHCARKILYLQRHSTDFRNLCLARRCWAWAFGGKVSGAQVFYFCNGKVKTLRIDNIWNFATFNLYTVPAKIIYFQSIHPIFEIFASAPRFWGRAFGWKVSGAQIFLFCNGKVKIFRIFKIWKFATFNLYTVPAKILYLQRYSPDFRNRWLSCTKLREGIWV